jgi:hypothetical protein
VTGDRDIANGETEDPLGLVLGGLLYGLVLGLALQALVGFAVRTSQASGPPASGLDLASTPARILLIGTASAAVAAGIATWSIVSPLRHPWRQGMLSIIAALGSFALALVTQPVDRMLGRPGLIGLALVAGIVTLLLARRLRGRPAP